MTTLLKLVVICALVAVVVVMAAFAVREGLSRRFGR